MPQYNVEAELSPWRRTAATIGDALARRPYYQAQAAARQQAGQQDAEMHGARLNTEQQQGRKYKVEADRGEMQMSAAKELMQWWRSNAVQNTNGNWEINGAAFNEALAAASGMGESANDSALATGNMMKTLREPGMADKTGAASPGSAIYDKKTGKVISQVPSAARERSMAELVDTETTVYPAVEGTPGTPPRAAQPGEQRSFMGMDWLARDKAPVPADPGTPGTPGTPERRVVRKIPRGGTEATQPAQPATQPMSGGGQPTAADPGLNDAEISDLMQASPRAGKPLDEATAKQILDSVGGDVAKARQKATQLGYAF